MLTPMWKLLQSQKKLNLLNLLKSQRLNKRLLNQNPLSKKVLKLKSIRNQKKRELLIPKWLQMKGKLLKLKK
jgi:hypothetical protein